MPLANAPAAGGPPEAGSGSGTPPLVSFPVTLYALPLPELQPGALRNSPRPRAPTSRERITSATSCAEGLLPVLAGGQAVVDDAQVLEDARVDRVRDRPHAAVEEDDVEQGQVGRAEALFAPAAAV